jgi:hypothetical protein
MAIGDRLREMRVAKKLSQGDIEKRTGLLRCYISRVENGLAGPGPELYPNLVQHDGKLRRLPNRAPGQRRLRDVSQEILPRFHFAEARSRSGSSRLYCKYRPSDCQFRSFDGSNLTAFSNPSSVFSSTQ